MGIRGWMLAALAVAALQGCASSVTTAGSGLQVMGKIEGIYVESRPGVLVEQSLARGGRDLPVWANVVLNAPTEDGRMTLSARLEDGLVVETGDLVAVRLAPVGSNNVAAGPLKPAMVAGVIDRGDTLAAPIPAREPLRRVSWTESLR